MVAVPSLGRSSQYPKIVVFPAPSGPINPKISPSLTSKETDATAKLFYRIWKYFDLNTHYLINKKLLSARASMLC
jgi:hypothetical protein